MIGMQKEWVKTFEEFLKNGTGTNPAADPNHERFAAQAVGVGVAMILKSNGLVARMMSTLSEQNVRLHQDLRLAREVS
jgi:hypothetical protein